MSLPSVALVLVFLSLAQGFAPFVKYSAVYNSKTDSWSVQPGINGSAWAEMRDFLHTAGWAILDLYSEEFEPDDRQAFAAGFVEGAITQPLIWDSFRSFANGTSYPIPSKLRNFILANDKWVRGQSAHPTENADYWEQVGLVLKQFDGLYAGYQQYAPADQKIEYDQFLLYQLNWDFGDIMTALGLSSKGKSLKSNPESYLDSHCSSLVKVSADGQNLFASHVTWTTFSAMLRVYKNYNTPFHSSGTKAPGVSFSSFPGNLPSGDDYYITSNNLVVMETTNGVMNTSLFRHVTEQTVMYWIRVIVANRMSNTGADWVKYFGMYNSGTYNNQWIVVNNNLFVPGSPIAPGTLYILEQVPGYIVSADESESLGKTKHWVSYNIPFFPFIYNVSDYPAYYQKYGNEYSYSECARAQIFRRDVDKVQTMKDMQHIMRYNKWQIDGLSLNDACRGISARCDLNSPLNTKTLNPYSAFGAVDCKLTSNQYSGAQRSLCVSGPTWDSQPIFVWNEEWEYVPHYGQPKIFGFDWITIEPFV